MTAARLHRLVSAMAAKVLGIVLAGGEGKRLWPLTADRAKPAVPFGGQLPAHRLRAVEPGQRRASPASAC